MEITDPANPGQTQQPPGGAPGRPGSAAKGATPTPAPEEGSERGAAAPPGTTYGPTRQARNRPKRYEISRKVWVGIGGAIQMADRSAAKEEGGEVIAEATPAQYEVLYKRGLTHLVQANRPAAATPPTQ